MGLNKGHNICPVVRLKQVVCYKEIRLTDGEAGSLARPSHTNVNVVHKHP